MASAETLTNDMRHEANTALLEVDKGLRSARVGDQCEAIVKFPLLIDRFPFPVVINAAFLKIAEVFRTGNNFLRLNILKVFQLSEKHLQKITSVDEFVRRVFSVMHSNDSLARAVTLRVFGSIASIVAERKNIHHSIHQGLESTDKVEVDAAINATSCLCKHSRTFAVGVCERVTAMVEGLTTPVSMKLRLFPILSLMKYDIKTATLVRELCIKLLPAYPSLSFITAILHTLTELAVGILIHLHDQVKLLLYYAGGDARLSVRLKALKELMRLACLVPHAWTQGMIQDFYSVMDGVSSEREKALCARVLYKLAGSLAVQNMTFLKDDGSFLALCYSPYWTVSSYIMDVVTRVVLTTTEGTEEEKQKEEMEEIGSMIIESLLIKEHSDHPEHELSLKVLLSSLTLLTSRCCLSESALDALLGILPGLNGPQAVLVCQALASIAAHAPGTWSHVTPTLLDYLVAKTDQHHRIILPVSTVLMQLHQGEADSAERLSFGEHVSPSLLSHVWGLNHSSRLWVSYKVARRASMMGFHELAESIYFKLSRVVTTVKFRNWLNALYQFSLAQCIIASSFPSSSSSSVSTADLIPSLSKSSAIVYNTIMLVKASNFSSFPGSFLRVFSSWLNAHYQLLATCISFYTLPPPTSSHSNFFENKLRMCVVQFQDMSEQFSDLYSSLFDADPSTLNYVSLAQPGKQVSDVDTTSACCLVTRNGGNIDSHTGEKLQQSCLLMASVVSSIGLSRKPLVSPGKVSTPITDAPVKPVEISDSFNTNYLLGKACRTVFQNSQAVLTSIQSLPFGEKHATLLIDCSRMILCVPIQLPKYFFSSMQVTSVKLALSPPPPATGGQHIVSLSLNTHLTLKVEGVVEHSGCELFRSPAAVYVQVIPKLEKLHNNNMKAPVLNSLERTEPVEKDYFEAQFLLELPVAGCYSVLVKASLLDEEGRVWHMGHRAKMMVVVEGGGDEGQRSQQKQREPSVVPGTSAGGSSGGGGGGKVGTSQSRNL